MLRLDLTERDGAKWFASRVSRVSGAREILSRCETPVRFDVFDDQLYLLIGKIFCLEPALLDFIVLFIACGFVKRNRFGPWLASNNASSLVLGAVGKASEYQQYLRAFLFQRYYDCGAVSRLLELAVYQQLQMPFGWFCNKYPQPLHMFPQLNCGSLIGSRFRSKFEYYEAQAIIWLRVLARDGTAAMCNLYYRLGPLHRCCAEEYALSWHRRPFAVIARRVANECMTLYLSVGLVCTE